MASPSDITIMRMVTDVAVAHLSNNKVETALLPQLMTELFQSYKTMETDQVVQPEREERTAALQAYPSQTVATAPAPVVEEAKPKPTLVPDAPVQEKAAEAVREEAPAETAKDSQGSRTTQKPAVPIEESVHDDYLVCLEDGKHLQMLKRYLRTHYNMTVEEYKRKWGLPHDYPTTAPAYSARKSQMAKLTGLGTRNKGRKRTRTSTAGTQA